MAFFVAPEKVSQYRSSILTPGRMGPGVSFESRLGFPAVGMTSSRNLRILSAGESSFAL